MYQNTAHVYDLIYESRGKDYAAESLVIHELIQERNRGAGTLLDVACGTGGHMRFFQNWYEVTGVDSNPAMLAEARNHLPEAQLVEADMRTFDLGATFDAITCLFSAIGYMRDTDELGAAVGTMAGHLNPGGVLVLDGWIRPDAFQDSNSTHLDVAQSGPVKVARVGRSRRHGSTTILELHHLIATPDGVEHAVDTHEMTLFSPEEYETALRGAGLTSEIVDCPMAERDRYVAMPT